LGRDKHLRAADFFDVATYPEIKFVSTRVEKKGKDKFVLHGDFTMKALPNRFLSRLHNRRNVEVAATRVASSAHAHNRRDFTHVRQRASRGRF
jgi:polyisoprenoid-binding protein YceI